MADEEEEDSPPSGAAGGAGGWNEAAAWGCALLAGLAFALAFGAFWLLGPDSGDCPAGFPCILYPPWMDRVLVGIVALVSGLYAVGVRALLRRPAPAGAGRKPRPPTWAALTGLTLFAMAAGGWLAPLAMALLGRVG